MINEDLREYLDRKFEEQNLLSKERMDAHIQMEILAHKNINDMMEQHNKVLFGNPDDDATPGLVKKVDRIESALSWVKGLGGMGLSGIIALIVEKASTWLGHK